MDITSCDGTTTATNKCLLSFSATTDYFNNIEWTKEMIGAEDGDNLLEIGEQAEITIDTTTPNKYLSLVRSLINIRIVSL
jgi:hypothetical protein